ncbi:glycosyltransferase family protein [Limnoglobus roseus]|uniref:GT4 family glycosyltransferase n=1 Tax=Limnoglobus roseus TaxID=2598579 RepID=A0A5C1ABW2_9BACT|nr:glycosyltransferase [Limnoglobus roseus]QEL16200.1 GT4 family glycosyltransferase [Limnoglobus roseus]
MSQAAVRPLVVFADDWGRHPSSCQHLVRHLLPHREIVWVNTIGTRPPRLDWGTAKRVMGKFKSWASPSGKHQSPGSEHATLAPRTISPKMWPSFKSQFGRELNRKLLLRSLRPIFESLPQPPNVITTLPLVADLVGELPAHRWTYYCVDDFSVWPGYDGETMLRMERDLVPKVQEIVTVSETLVAHIAKLDRPAHLLTHGVDLDHWTTKPPEKVPGLDGPEPPFVVFWGVIDRRMDVAFVKALAASLRVGSLVLVGPREDPAPELVTIPRVRVLPPMPFAKLPALAATASVLVMPYADLPVTRAMQPLKLKEYLVTGKPVVVRDLPSTRPWADCCDVCDTAEGFAARVNERLQGGLPAGQQAARERLEDEGWAEKAKQFERWVDGVTSATT